MNVLVVLTLAYLLGSVSFSYVIVRLLEGIDIRTVGSGNAGATNVLRASGRLPALLALLLDIGKGVAAVLLARRLGVGPWMVAGAGGAVVVGHIYPIFLGFRGGKGVATAGGTLATLAPLPALLGLGIFLAVVGASRFVSLGSMVVAALFPLLIHLGGRVGWVRPEEHTPLVLAGAGIGALILFKHRENLGRLIRGTESRLGQRVELPEDSGGEA